MSKQNMNAMDKKLIDAPAICIPIYVLAESTHGMNLGWNNINCERKQQNEENMCIQQQVRIEVAEKKKR